MSVISKAGSGFAILAASALVLSGCAAAEEPVAEETTEEETTEESPAAEELSLKIGTALPVTGTLAFLRPPKKPVLHSPRRTSTTPQRVSRSRLYSVTPETLTTRLTRRKSPVFSAKAFPPSLVPHRLVCPFSSSTR